MYFRDAYGKVYRCNSIFKNNIIYDKNNILLKEKSIDITLSRVMFQLISDSHNLYISDGINNIYKYCMFLIKINFIDFKICFFFIKLIFFKNMQYVYNNKFEYKKLKKYKIIILLFFIFVKNVCFD